MNRINIKNWYAGSNIIIYEVYKRNCSPAKNIGLGLDQVDNSGSIKRKGKLNRNCYYEHDMHDMSIC